MGAHEDACATLESTILCPQMTGHLLVLPLTQTLAIDALHARCGLTRITQALLEDFAREPPLESQTLGYVTINFGLIVSRNWFIAKDVTASQGARVGEGGEDGSASAACVTCVEARDMAHKMVKRFYGPQFL